MPVLVARLVARECCCPGVSTAAGRVSSVAETSVSKGRQFAGAISVSTLLRGASFPKSPVSKFSGKSSSDRFSPVSPSSSTVLCWGQPEDFDSPASESLRH